MKRLFKRIALTATVVMAFSISSAMAAPPSSSAWVVLDSGRQGDYLWSVKARRSDDSARAGSRSDAEQPCLLVGTKCVRGPFSYGRSRYQQCSDEPGRLAATDAPLIASGVVSGSGSRPKLTVVGMIFAAKVRRVRITNLDGST